MSDLFKRQLLPGAVRGTARLISERNGDPSLLGHKSSKRQEVTRTDGDLVSRRTHRLTSRGSCSRPRPVLPKVPCGPSRAVLCVTRKKPRSTRGGDVAEFGILTLPHQHVDLKDQIKPVLGNTLL